jgi:hypothetical protein
LGPICASDASNYTFFCECSGAITIDVEVVDTDYRAFQLPRAAPIAPPWDILASPSGATTAAAAGVAPESRPRTPLQRSGTPTSGVGSPRPPQSSSGPGVIAGGNEASSPVPSSGAAAAAGGGGGGGGPVVAAAVTAGGGGLGSDEGRQGGAGAAGSGGLARLGPAFAPSFVLGALDIVVRGCELKR